MLFFLLCILFEELWQGSAGRHRRAGEYIVKSQLPKSPANLLAVHKRGTGLPFFPRLYLLDVVSKFCEFRLDLLILGVLASRGCGDTEVEHEGYCACGAK